MPIAVATPQWPLCLDRMAAEKYKCSFQEAETRAVHPATGKPEVIPIETQVHFFLCGAWDSAS